MSGYCNNCGAVIEEGVNFCPHCGASLNGSSGTVNQNYAAGSNSGWSDAAKAAAMVGGAVIGASTLSNLARRVTHRRRPPYMPPMGGPPPMGRPGGPPPMGRPGGPGMGGPGRGF
ncbi:MAG: zinc ribbon domain-containing protein, partial [Clostridiales bacterium]|nr:zinc ribbon domain-containing protein [Clostridiales bacterium]